MKKSRLQPFLQSLAVVTQFPHFTWLYRQIYALAVRLCVRRLQRIRGVGAIYLRRGLASGRPLYGLSDIDLLVMVDGKPHHRVRAQVLYQYELLRRLIPMLPEGELALYDPEEFRTLHEQSAFYRHRFEQGRRHWQRLFGEDIFRNLPPPPSPEEERSLALQELSPAWYYLSQELTEGEVRPPFVRRYVAYKSLAESARALVVSEGEDPGIPREIALQRAAAQYPDLAPSLKVVQRLRRHLLSLKPIPLDALLETSYCLTRGALAANVAGNGFRRVLRLQALPPEVLPLPRFEAALATIKKACAALEDMERAVLVPRLSFDSVAELGMDLEGLAGATMDALDLVVIGRELPPAASLRRFNSVLDPLQPLMNPFFCDLTAAVALRPLPGRTVKTAAWDPEFFACLSSTKPLDQNLEVAAAVEVQRPFPRADALEQRARTLLALFHQREVFQIATRSFFTLFWEAGRGVWLAAQARQPGSIDVPVKSSQVLEALVALTPAVEPTLRQIHQEYCREAGNRPSAAVRYVNWARWYALHLEELLFSPDQPHLDPPPRARTELTISVAVVTRNRAQLLGTALQSLVDQVRPPDQVVVVDNASEDDTPAVALSFARQLNLTLVREEAVGIPQARNKALKHCTGDLVAFFDDDCKAEPHWLFELEVPFLKDPHIGAVGGSLLPLTGQSELVAQFYDSRMPAAWDVKRSNSA
jgi:predicted nucleotidyltransferase